MTPEPPTPPPDLEEAWSALRAPLEWQPGFALLFVFGSRPFDALRERAADWLRLRTLPLHRIEAIDAADFDAGLLDRILEPERAHAPMWVDAWRGSDQDATRLARDNFPARLNE
ncbi:MAG: hypothetical protein U1F52_13355 [Burkholderiales bacterium]